MTGFLFYLETLVRSLCNACICPAPSLYSIGAVYANSIGVHGKNLPVLVSMVLLGLFLVLWFLFHSSDVTAVLVVLKSGTGKSISEAATSSMLIRFTGRLPFNTICMYIAMWAVFCQNFDLFLAQIVRRPHYVVLGVGAFISYRVIVASSERPTQSTVLLHNTNAQLVTHLWHIVWLSITHHT